MKKFLMILVLLTGLSGLSSCGMYNKIVSAEEQVNSAWAQVENVYQRRLDLIPNLVETVKAYAAHEKDTFQSVIEARAKATQTTLSPEAISNPEKLAQFQEAQGQLSAALGRLMVVAERYPDLKANQNFLTLQTQLEGTENRITVERMRFNETAQHYNTLIKSIPERFIASLGDFEPKAYFKSDPAASKAPEVKFQ